MKNLRPNPLGVIVGAPLGAIGGYFLGSHTVQLLSTEKGGELWVALGFPLWCFIGAVVGGVRCALLVRQRGVIVGAITGATLGAVFWLSFLLLLLRFGNPDQGFVGSLLMGIALLLAGGALGDAVAQRRN
jgi:hypothetical protein